MQKLQNLSLGMKWNVFKSVCYHTDAHGLEYWQHFAICHRNSGKAKLSTFITKVNKKLLKCKKKEKKNGLLLCEHKRTECVCIQ